MSYSLAWIALRQASKEDVFCFLNLFETGEVGSRLDFEISGKIMPNGWFLVALADIVDPLTNDTMIAELSHQRDIYLCQIDEAFLSSSLSFFCSGKQMWNVCHFGEIAPEHLSVEGEPPSQINDIFASAKHFQAKEDGVDFVFDVPIKLGDIFTGFRHDQAHSLDWQQFERR